MLLSEYWMAGNQSQPLTSEDQLCASLCKQEQSTKNSTYVQNIKRDFFYLPRSSGHSPFKILEVLNISELQENFCILMWTSLAFDTHEVKMSFYKIRPEKTCKRTCNEGLTHMGERLSPNRIQWQQVQCPQNSSDMVILADIIWKCLVCNGRF